MSEYFHSGEHLRFSFYRTPKSLFLNDEYSTLSADAKLLYSVLLDRVELSARNGLHDEIGRIYVYFTVEQAGRLLHFGKNKTTRLFGELEKAGLIDRVRQGLGRASIIYPKKFADSDASNQGLKTLQNEESRLSKTGLQEASKQSGINTEYSNTEVNNTNPSIGEIEDGIKTQIEYELLAEREDPAKLDEVVSIMTELMCINEPSIRIGGIGYPAELVRHRLSLLRSDHIEYVLDCMSSSQTKIGNIKAYLIATLFNAPATMEHHIQAEVNHDFAQ